jgi:tRNA modification GTPase
MSYFNDDTIAAIASAPEVAAAVGVIRISGKDSWPVASSLMEKMNGAAFTPEKVESHKLYRTVLKAAAGQMLDDGMFVWMRGPHSFTGEDVVEFHLHGNPYLLRRVMKELISRGAREALPGEFSFRAFQNGKLSLDQAESVADLISSRSEESAKRALGQLLGHGKRELEFLKRELVDRLAEIEVDIDFSDQGLSIIDYTKWCAKLVAWRERVGALRAEFLASQPLREGIRLSLVGAPNSGKSSLFNRLLGEDRSIVSALAGTTRDVVRETLYLNGVLFRVSDTAGIRNSGDAIESEGIDRSFGEVRSAQAVLWLFDGLDAQEGELEARWDALTAHLPKHSKVLAVWNKADQAPAPSAAWMGFFEAKGIQTATVSAASGAGVSGLLSLLSGLFQASAPVGQDFLLSRWRHYEVLGAASEAVAWALEKVRREEKFPDLLAIDLRTALSKIGEINGEFSSEDLLNHIFAEFCIGK